MSAIRFSPYGSLPLLGAVVISFAVIRGADAAEPTFPPAVAWTQDVSTATRDAHSAEIINWLAGKGGFGTGEMRIDFSIEVLEADDSAPFLGFTPTADFYTPDCDHVPVPVPAGGALEGESGYACAGDGDCHLIVWHRPTQRLYEMWRANLTGGVFEGGCLAVWNLGIVPPAVGRGEQCTSADAAGLPIAPLLFSADELAAGEIRHAIRFVLPNTKIRRRAYVRPATHATGAACGASYAPPYGARLRLRADFPLASLPNEGARIVARAMQRYGMILADGGNIALTARSDRFTAAKWSGRLGTRDLTALRVTDFEVLDSGPVLSFTGDCQRGLSAPGRPQIAGTP